MTKNDKNKKKKKKAQVNNSRKEVRDNNNIRSTGCNSESHSGIKDSTDKDNVNTSKPNDISWYAFDPALLRDSSNIPYSWPVGITVDQTNDLYTKQPANTTAKHVPGIYTLELITSPGISTTGSSPINIAARNIYSFVRHANSGHSNYDSQDLMLYLLAMDEACMFYFNCARAYGLINLYNNQNRYFPKAAVQAAGFDYDDLSKNMADFRYTLNAYVVRLASMCLPLGMPYFDRHAWLYSGIYMDGTSAKAQAYMYKPIGYRKYNEMEAGGGKLQFVRFTATGEGNLITLNDIKAMADDIISPIIGSEDLNIMSGDILKAYGSANIRQFATIPEDYVVGPVYDEEVLSQFANASVNYIFPSHYDDGELDITQDASIGAGNILFNPKLQPALDNQTKNAYQRTASQIINLNLNEPGPTDTMIATRLMNILVPDEANGDYLLDSCGSEFVGGANIYLFDDEHVLKNIDVAKQMPYFWSVSDAKPISHLTLLLQYMSYMAIISRFRFAPQFDLSISINYPTTGDDPSALAAGFYPIMQRELDNYALIEKKVLKNMHETALLSLFHVPQLAKVPAYK